MILKRDVTVVGPSTGDATGPHIGGKLRSRVGDPKKGRRSLPDPVGAEPAGSSQGISTLAQMYITDVENALAQEALRTCAHSQKWIRTLQNLCQVNKRIPSKTVRSLPLWV